MDSSGTRGAVEADRHFGSFVGGDKRAAECGRRPMGVPETTRCLAVVMQHRLLCTGCAAGSGAMIAVVLWFAGVDTATVLQWLETVL